jgi:hypothetical protein
MFSTRVPVSEFTKRALEGRVKEMEQETFFSMSDLYGILSSARADHLSYAKELHKGLCKVDPPTAQEFRESLESDAALVSPKLSAKVEQPDDLNTKMYCDKLTTALLGSEEDKEDAMRRLHEHLSGRLRRTVYPQSAHMRNLG